LRTGTAIEEAHRVTTPATFEELLEEGESEPVEGWDFSWFDGRASEERPSVEGSEGTTGFSRWGNRVKFQL
jgi:hypothetical protein